MADAADEAHPTRVLAVLVVAVVAFAFQETSLVPAVPHIQRALGGSRTGSALLQSGFLIVASVATPFLGRLGDTYGKRKLLLIALGIYLVGTVGGALSSSLWTLIACRAVQGVGGATFATSFAILREVGGPRRLGVMIGVLVGAFGVGMGAGYAIVGPLIAATSWHAIFWVGAVLIALAIVVVALGVPESRERHAHRLDVLGAVLLGAAPSTIIVGITVSSRVGWGSWQELVLLGVAIAFGVLWVERERHAEDPLIDVRQLVRRTVLLPNLASLLAGWSAFSLLFLVPRFVQAGGPGFAASSEATGDYLVPFAIGIVIGGPLGGVLGRRWGGKWPFVVGMALLGVACGLCALVHGGRWPVMGWLLAAGAGFGASIGAAGTFVTEAAPKHATTVAAAFNTVMRLVGGGIGSELAASLLGVIGPASAPRDLAYTANFWIASAAALLGAGVAAAVPAVTPARARSGRSASTRRTGTARPARRRAGRGSRPGTASRRARRRRTGRRRRTPRA